MGAIQYLIIDCAILEFQSISKAMAVSKSKAQKELEAQKARTAALKHRQSLKSGAALAKDADKNDAKRDNTLEILRRQAIANQIKDGKEHELKARAVFLQQRTTVSQSMGTSAKSTLAICNINEIAQSLAVNAGKEALPAGWQAVEDKTNGKKYYWNTQTNETSWEKPESKKVSAKEEKLSLPTGWEVVIDRTSLKEYFWNKNNNETRWERPTSTGAMAHKDSSTCSAGSLLPPGWVQTVHPATKQAFYVNDATGEKSFKRPMYVAENGCCGSSSSSNTTGNIGANDVSSKKRGIGEMN